MPTFNATFQSFHPRISFQLHTVFLCVLDDYAPEEGGVSDVSVARDIDWTEAKLPSRINQRRHNDITQRGLSHTSQIDFDLIMPAIINQESGDDIVESYSDALARAPVITLDNSMLIEYPLVNHEIRKENKVELLRSRYNNDQRMWRVYPKGKYNPGGAHSHAAKMWQAKDLLRVSWCFRDKRNLRAQISTHKKALSWRKCSEKQHVGGFTFVCKVVRFSKPPCGAFLSSTIDCLSSLTPIFEAIIHSYL